MTALPKGKLSRQIREALRLTIGNGAELIKTLSAIALCRQIGPQCMQPTVSDSMRAIEMLLELAMSPDSSDDSDASEVPLSKQPYSVLRTMMREPAHPVKS